MIAQEYGVGEGGTDFVCSDIVWPLAEFIVCLENNGFRFDVDRLWFLGSIDFDNYTSDAIALLEAKWFRSLLTPTGYHFIEKYYGIYASMRRNRGTHITDELLGEKIYCSLLINDLPAAISMVSPKGRKCAFVYSQTPLMPWSEFVKQLQAKGNDIANNQLLKHALTGTSRHSNPDSSIIAGIDCLIHRSVVNSTSATGNTIFLCSLSRGSEIVLSGVDELIDRYISL